MIHLEFNLRSDECSSLVRHANEKTRVQRQVQGNYPKEKNLSWFDSNLQTYFF